MDIIFAATPEFAVPCLQALIHSQHRVVAVLTQPDRPAGRGRHLQQSPIKQLALQHQLPVYQPASLRDSEVQQNIKQFMPDLMVVVAYGLLLPSTVLRIPHYGCLNVHASLLPRWRGASPMQMAILQGDKQTGVSIMQMEQGLDTGPVLLTRPCVITEKETGGSLHDKLATLGAEALKMCLTDLPTFLANAKKQPEALATYAGKISKQEACIDWKTPAVDIERLIRAYQPWPVAYTMLGERRVRIHAAELIEITTGEQPGKILSVASQGIDVATGKGGLRITQLQLPGGHAMAAADLLRGYRPLFLHQSFFQN